MKIQQFVDEGLGNTAHLLIDDQTGVAVLIDPLRDVDRYLAAAQVAGVQITYVLETHVHNDFISGSRELAAQSGARIGASARAELAFEHQPLREGDVIYIGSIKVSVLETPGHTPEHLSYLAEDVSAPDQAPVLFSGGSLLVGAVSRTDLLGPESAEELAYALYSSLHEKILRLPDDIAVYPTHGAGSFCTAAPGAARSTTIGQERHTNWLLGLDSPQTFVSTVLSIMPSYPTYFRYMRAINQRGPRILGKIPKPVALSPAEVQARIAQGEVVVDMRPVGQYLAGHIPGVYHVELRPAFASWVGWVVPFGSAVVLVPESPATLEEAVRPLIRIGYDDLPGYLAGGMAAWEAAGLPIRRLSTLTVAEVRKRLERGEPLVVLDVRQDAEWLAGHLPQAQHIEAGALAAGQLTLPREVPIVTHCGHEQRAATALSLLERQGYTNLHLMAGGWQAWEAQGFPIVREQEATCA